jgi:cell cycle checkpoint protein
MKKILGKVCKEHKIVLPDVSSFHGDLRHALLTLQFSASRLSDRRDEPLSAFHALGKLLYAKRKESPTYDGNEANRRPPLQFVPEEVIQNSSMSLYASLHFLHYHAPDFFTDSIELSRAFDLYSDAAVLMDCVSVERYSQPSPSLRCTIHCTYPSFSP